MSYSIYNMGMHEYDISGKDPRSARRHISAEQFENGDPGAFGRMYPLLYRQAGRIVERRDTQDVAQDALEKLVKHPPVPDPEGSVLPYTMRVVTRTAIDHIRSSNAEKRGRGLVELYGLTPDAEDEFARGQYPETVDNADPLAVWKVLKQVIPNHGRRAALMLVDGEGLSYKEAATILGVPIGTVQSRVSRAREQARQSEKLRAFFLESND